MEKSYFKCWLDFSSYLLPRDPIHHKISTMKVVVLWERNTYLKSAETLLIVISQCVSILAEDFQKKYEHNLHYCGSRGCKTVEGKSWRYVNNVTFWIWGYLFLSKPHCHMPKTPFYRTCNFATWQIRSPMSRNDIKYVYQFKFLSKVDLLIN